MKLGFPSPNSVITLYVADVNYIKQHLRHNAKVVALATQSRTTIITTLVSSTIIDPEVFFQFSSFIQKTV